MSLDNASSAVTYTSISSYLNRPSWCIPLVNAGELSGMDLYEEVENQPYADDILPIDESPVHIANSVSIEEDSIDYPDEPKDDDEDPKEDLEEDHTDYPADGEDVPVVDPVPSAGDTEAFETDKSAPTPRSPQTRVPFYQTRLRRARKTVRLEPPMSASMEARIAEHAATPIPPTSPTYHQAPLGQGLIRSPGHDAQTIARVADRAEDVGYVHRQESEDFYTQLHDAQTDRRDIRLDIDVVRGQRTTYKTELREVRQAYLSSKARNRALLARLETLETHMSRMEWQRQSAEDLAVRQMMRTQVLEARARIDTVEDADSSC
ncbi:hypothetical protein Tco_0713112 [Tanacetum coccineum]